MSGRYLCGKNLWVVLLWGLSATGTVQAGVSLQYMSARRVPEATLLEIKADAARVNRLRAWWCEGISLWKEINKTGVYLRGDTKLLCTPDDGRVKPPFGVVEYMAWRDSLTIVRTLEGWSKRYELVWEMDLAGEPVGKVVAGKADRELREFLAKWGREVHAFGDGPKDRACESALGAHPHAQAWKPLPACPEPLFAAAESDACQLARLLEAGWQRCAELERKRNPDYASRFRAAFRAHPGGQVELDRIRRWGFTHRPPPPGQQHHKCLVQALESMGLVSGAQFGSEPRRMQCDQRQVPEGFHGKYLTKPPEIPRGACVRGKTACWLAEP